METFLQLFSLFLVVAVGPLVVVFGRRITFQF